MRALCILTIYLGQLEEAVIFLEIRHDNSTHTQPSLNTLTDDYVHLEGSYCTALAIRRFKISNITDASRSRSKNVL